MHLSDRLACSHLHLIVQVTRLSTSHTPGKAQWQGDLQRVHDSLSDSSSGAASPQPLSSDNSHAALKEFSANGQMGLDELLDALDGGLEVSKCQMSTCVHANAVSPVSHLGMADSFLQM